MIELVFAIVVLGIIAALAMPRIDRDLRQEAAHDILSAIRYTQHLALIDDKHEFDDPRWQRKYWRIDFGTCNNGSGLYYSIGSDADKSGGGYTRAEAAVDPLNNMPLFADNLTCGNANTNPHVLLGERYGVIAIDATNCNNNQHIGFDHLGRPHANFGRSNIPDYASYMNRRCTLVFTLSNGDNFSIDIVPETGYAQIVGQNAS